MKNFLGSYWKECLIMILIGVCIVLTMSTTCIKQKNHKLETNIAALNDSVHTYQLKNGELMYEKQGYILEKKELQQYLNISTNEIKELECKLGSALATISKLQGQVNVDTLVMKDSVTHKNDTTYIDFQYTDEWLQLSGTTIYQDSSSCTTVNNLYMDVPIKVGTSKDDKWFVTTENPYVNFTSVEGANLVKATPKRWTVGFNFGVGGIFGYGVAGCTDGIVRTGWIGGFGGYVGIGLTYKLGEF